LGKNKLESANKKKLTLGKSTFFLSMKKVLS